MRGKTKYIIEHKKISTKKQMQIKGIRSYGMPQKRGKTAENKYHNIPLENLSQELQLTSFHKFSE